jgi:hypothetical protein
MRPFYYDNIESHVSGQRPMKWVEYKQLDSIVERQTFFDDVPIGFRNLIKAHFPFSSFGVERQIIFDIVDVIACDMMFDPVDIIDSDADNDAEENDPAFGNDTEHNVVLRRRIQKATLAKERALSLFQRMDQGEEEEEGNVSYSYSVTIPKLKIIVFQLFVRYMSCSVSFRLASNILSCTYDLLHNLVLCVWSCHDVTNYIRVVCVVNLQRIARHLHRAWAFSIVLDSATHKSTPYLDVRFQSSCRPSITLLTCMRLHFQCLIGTPARSCSRWLYLYWTFFAPIARFIYLVCLLMEPTT